MKLGHNAINFILIILSALALFTPVFSAYVIGVVMALIMAIEVVRGRRISLNSGRRIFISLCEDLTRRSLVFWLLLLVSAIGSTWYVDSPNISSMLRSMGNFGVKYILLWTVLTQYWRRIAGDHAVFQCFTFTYAGAAFIHFVYCMIQRNTGVDWAHGLNAKLAAGRYAYGVYRISGFMGHPLTMGYCQAVAAICCFGFWRVSSSRAEKTAWLLATICSFFVLALSGSRGPQIAMAAGFIISMSTPDWRRNIHGILGSIVILAITGYYFGIFRRFFEITLHGTGGDMRIIHWQVFWRIFMEHPIFGVGPGAPREVISAYYNALGASDNIRLAHNAWLQFAAEFGVLGFAGAMVWFRGWWLFLRSMQRLTRSGKGLLAVILLGTLTQNNLQDSQFLYAMTMWGILIVVREVNLNDGGFRNAKDDDFDAGKGGSNS
jgi:hypothetical protein